MENEHCKIKIKRTRLHKSKFFILCFILDDSSVSLYFSKFNFIYFNILVFCFIDFPKLVKLYIDRFKQTCVLEHMFSDVDVMKLNICLKLITKFNKCLAFKDKHFILF